MRELRRLLPLLAALLLVLPARADVIWEPEGDFYDSHRQQCDFVGRPYAAAGYGGHVTLYVSPQQAEEVAALDNGTEMTVQFTWEGERLTWGAVYTHGDYLEGWIPMDDLVPVYDSRQFIQDHQGQLQDYDGSGDSITQAVLYAYPGAQRTRGTVEENRDYMPLSQGLDSLYTDDAGHRWSHLEYYMGRVDAWICLDDPMNARLPAQPRPEVRSVSQQQGADAVDRAGLETGQAPYLAAAVLVAGVAALTLALICKFYPKHKR